MIHDNFKHHTTSVFAPLNVQASQSSDSTPVEVSWSPPSGGAATITGYRIFYDNGRNLSVPAFVTSIGLLLNGSYIGHSVSIRSEIDHNMHLPLFSQMVTVTVSMGTCLWSVLKCLLLLASVPLGKQGTSLTSCFRDVSVAVGGIISMEILIVMIIVVAAVLRFWMWVSCSYRR